MTPWQHGNDMISSNAVFLLKKEKKKKTSREKNTALHKCSHDASQTGVLPKPLTDCCVLPGKPDLWHVIWRVQLGPVNLLGKQWVLVSPCCLVAHQAPGSPTETLDSTQRMVTPCLADQKDQVTTAQLWGRASLGDREKIRYSLLGAVEQAKKRNSHILDFAIMGNHSLICKPCLVLWFQIILVDVLHFPSQGTSKGLCKTSHSLYKLNSSGLSWPATPPPLFSQTPRTPYTTLETQTEREVQAEEGANNREI